MKFKHLFQLLAVMVIALIVQGCTWMGFTPEQSQAILKTVTQATANAVVLAYNAGGNQFAYNKIDEMVTKGTITKAQGDALKADVDAGINELPKIFGAQLVKVQRPAARPATAPPATK